MTKVDAVVIGAGNAGQAAASVLRAAGRSVVLAEQRDVGGTCPLRGCVPKKVLVAAAETLDIIARASRQGITVGAPKLDWGALIAKKRSIIAGTSESEEKALRGKGIDVVRGHARFIGERAVAIADERYEAESIVVASGSRPRTLDVKGAEHIVTSDDLLELDTLPESIAFVGVGVIAFEFTHVFARAGARVTLLETVDRPLGGHDPTCVDRLVLATRALGVEIVSDIKPRSIEIEGTTRIVTYEHEGKTRTLRVDCVANGTGRPPAYDGLGLEEAGITLHEGKPKLDSQLRSLDNPRVWFAGDARPGPQLSPVATYDGRQVARAILGSKEPIDHEGMPSVVFAIPSFASVGKTEEAAKKAGLTFDVIENDMHTWKSAETYGEDVAYAKVLVEKGSDKILGAHILRRHAEETIHAFAFAIKYGMTARDLREWVFAFPTFSADVKYLVG